MRINIVARGQRSLQWVALVAVAYCLAAPVFAGEGCRIKGIWRSDEARTIADMKKHSQLTDKQIQALANGFFGKLVFEFTCSKARTYREEEGAQSAAWFPYRVLERGSDYVVLGDSKSTKAEGLRFDFVGQCFKTPVGNLGFSEFFCRNR